MTENTTKPLLDVRDLTVAYPSRLGPKRALHGVTFSVGSEKLGIVGESGSGKSTTGRAILKLLPPGAVIEAERLQFEELDLLKMGERRMRRVRGARISMILQDPKHALNPLKTVGAQITESYLIHHPRAGRGETRDRVMAMLEKVKIRDAHRVYDLYPHEISGGMGQRVMIAMMMIPAPKLIIADEPTSALDVTVRRSVLDTLAEVIEGEGAGLIFITHDLPLVSTFCDRILVMYAGRVVEEIAAHALARAQHPYTCALLGSLPPLDQRVDMLQVPTRDPAWLTGPTYRTEVA